MLTTKDIELLRHYSWFVENPTREQLESGKLIELSVTPNVKRELAKRRKDKEG